MTKHLIGEQLANSLPLFVKGEPYTIDEIDKHPDRERIWRTLLELACYYEVDVNPDFIYSQKDMDDSLDEEYNRGYSEGQRESGVDYDSGYHNGFEHGKTVGYDMGYVDGRKH